ncbi:MAG TPA: type VI secretion protein IcmF/TssM N-terminal domain-containing protein [Pirellulales bacterium]|nr:type VI secretion protein IcmF/TssM N-terminal domain-containing protein [Pirellulales bacterium]
MSAFLSYLAMPFTWLLSLPRRLQTMSLPARIAMLIAIFLVCCVVTAYLGFYFSRDRTPWELWWRPGRLATLAVLVIVIPLVIYQALRLWWEGEVSRFPDIDEAWKAGLAELSANGLDLSSIPIFLVVGSTGSSQERSLFQAARLSFRISECPKGPAPLHWYASPTAIYLCLSDVGQLSKLAAMGDSLPADAPSFQPQSSSGNDDIRGTLMAGGEPSIQRSIAGSAFMPQAEPSHGGGLGGGGGDIRGTMMVGASADVGNLVAQLARGNRVSLPPQEAIEQTQRLEYFCRLLKRARHPLCPVNGIVTLLPFGVIQLGVQEGKQIESAAKADLNAMRDELQLRCPVTALVVGLEREKGFRELVRRVGANSAKNQRFGKGFGVWGSPTPQQVEALCEQACGAFEDFVYALFREAGSLSKPGNTKLYAMLCNVRHNLQNRLASILVSAFSADPNYPDDGLLFGGCYFAAAGDGDERQAFVKGVVVDKLIDQQEDLEWTSAAMAEEHRFRRNATLLWTFDAGLLAVLGGTLLYKMFGT